ncbi:hypothetical protein D9M68_651490 [compost metagenome]
MRRNNQPLGRKERLHVFRNPIIHHQPAGFFSGSHLYPAAGRFRDPGAESRAKRVRVRTGLDPGQRQLVLHIGRGHHSAGRGVPGGKPLWRHQARAGPQRARLPQFHLVRHAVLGRHGDRADVLRRGGTRHALHVAAGGRGRHRCGGPRGHEDHFLPLGAACLGHLRGGGADPGFLQLSAWPTLDAAFGAVSPDREPHPRAHRACRRYFRHHRHGAGRGDVPGARRGADQQRPQSSVRHARRRAHADHPDHRDLRPGDIVGGQRPG